MTQVLTAKEWFETNKMNVNHRHPTFEDMVEFAKLHVKAVLENAAKKAETEEHHGWMFVNKHSILNAYPNELIK